MNNYQSLHRYHVHRTRGHRSPLQLAIKEGLSSVVEQLCSKGADMNLIDPNEGDCPLWQALESGQQEIASILVSSIFYNSFIAYLVNISSCGYTSTFLKKKHHIF